MSPGLPVTVPPLRLRGSTLRLDSEQRRAIREAVTELAGPRARVRVFGSRLDDTARGGDVDLLVELNEPALEPARLSAQIAARVSRAMHGRRVDVLIAAPNLQSHPVHEVARRTGEPV